MKTRIRNEGGGRGAGGIGWVGGWVVLGWGGMVVFVVGCRGGLGLGWVEERGGLGGGGIWVMP